MGRKDAFPWSRRGRGAGGPAPRCPPRSWTTHPRRSRRGGSVRRPSPCGERGGGEETDPEVQVAPDRSRPWRKAFIPPRTSSAISLHVSASALSTASGFPRAGSMRAAPSSITTSWRSPSSTRRRTRGRPTSNTSGSKRSTSLRNAVPEESSVKRSALRTAFMVPDCPFPGWRPATPCPSSVAGAQVFFTLGRSTRRAGVYLTLSHLDFIMWLQLICVVLIPLGRFGKWH